MTIEAGNLSRQTLAGDRTLLERDSELAAVAGLLTATAGGGRLLAIEGPPGVGKTSLIAEAKVMVQDAGWQLLSSRGSEFERSSAFGIVRRLFEPLLASLGAGERSCSGAPPPSRSRCLTRPRSPSNRGWTPRWRRCTAFTG